MTSDGLWYVILLEVLSLTIRNVYGLQDYVVYPLGDRKMSDIDW